jgi:hypothetical protein
MAGIEQTSGAVGASVAAPAAARTIATIDMVVRRQEIR